MDESDAGLAASVAMEIDRITANVGDTVMQGSVSGLLNAALTGDDMTSVVITSSSGVVFDTNADIVIVSTVSTTVDALNVQSFQQE